MISPLINLPDGLNAALREVNSLRQSSSGPLPPSVPAAESIINKIFSAEHHLAIYGSLAPGKSNHAVVEEIRGKWSDGFVHGVLHDAGWGSEKGYPGMKWQPDAESILVKVLTSKHLADHWQRLDEFEGSDYRRILVPVETEDGILVVANIYELRAGG